MIDIPGQVHHFIGVHAEEAARAARSCWRSRPRSPSGGLGARLVLRTCASRRFPSRPPKRSPGLYAFLRDKWRVDELYDAIVVRLVFALARARRARSSIRTIVDGVVNGTGAAVARALEHAGGVSRPATSSTTRCRSSRARSCCSATTWRADADRHAIVFAPLARRAASSRSCRASTSAASSARRSRSRSCRSSSRSLLLAELRAGRDAGFQASRSGSRGSRRGASATTSASTA